MISAVMSGNKKVLNVRFGGRGPWSLMATSYWIKIWAKVRRITSAATYRPGLGDSLTICYYQVSADRGALTKRDVHLQSSSQLDWSIPIYDFHFAQLFASSDSNENHRKLWDWSTQCHRRELGNSEKICHFLQVLLVRQRKYNPSWVDELTMLKETWSAPMPHVYKVFPTDIWKAIPASIVLYRWHSLMKLSNL
jgi:hypothetical protein